MMWRRGASHQGLSPLSSISLSDVVRKEDPITGWLLSLLYIKPLFVKCFRWEVWEGQSGRTLAMSGYQFDSNVWQDCVEFHTISIPDWRLLAQFMMQFSIDTDVLKGNAPMIPCSRRGCNWMACVTCKDGLGHCITGQFNYVLTICKHYVGNNNTWRYNQYYWCSSRQLERV